MGDVGWPGEGRIMIIKVSVVTIDSVRWEQNVGTLVSLGGNVLGYPLGIRFCDGRGAGGGGLGQMLCSCRSFSTICQWSRTDLENCLPSNEYGVTTGRTDLELDAFGVL